MAFVLVTVISITPVLLALPGLKVLAAASEQVISESMTITKEDNDQVNIENGQCHFISNRDAFAVSDLREESFVYEAEVTINEAKGAAGIMFGVQNKEVPNQESIVANISPSNGEARLFRFSGGHDLKQPVRNEAWKNQTNYTLKVEVVSGQITYYINDIMAISTSAANYREGCIGIMSFNTNIEFTSASIKKLTGISAENTGVDKTFNTNLPGWQVNSGTWQITDSGLQGNGIGDNAIFSKQKVDNFILEADLTINSGDQGSSILFRANSNHSIFYMADITYWDTGAGKKARIIKFYEEGGQIKTVELGQTYILPDQSKDNYHLKIEALGSSLKFFVDDDIAVDITDDAYDAGYIGLNVCSMTSTFQNVNYSKLDVTDAATLSGITLSDGVEIDQDFDQSVMDYTVDVPYTINSIKITPEIVNNGSVKVNGAEVVVGTASQAIPLEYGTTLIPIKVITDGNGYSKTTTLHIQRNYNPDEIYDLPYRPQYHFRPQAHWINDPNGMVYFKGEYHMFYQYYPYSNNWGPMHWGHSVSTDLIHWKELPIALYPDENGYIFSGSAVVDENNTSGFFDGIPGGGLVAIFTHDNNGLEQQSIAYSKDNGRTWTKYEDNPVIPFRNDPLNHRDFRDPKVFWHEEAQRWMLIVAGGPVRIYSSDNLKTWTLEAAYNELHSECPDLFPLKVAGTDDTKWVVTGSGRKYLIGDFKEDGGKWKFIRETDWIDMNFAPDAYASQTYSNTPDGRTIMINWATDVGYGGSFASITGESNFCGFFTLQSKLTLQKNQAGEIRLYQTPIEEYKSLRDETKKISLNNINISPSSNNPLKNFSGNQYEIVAEFTPSAGATEIGFKLRVGEGQETIVSYNVSNDILSINRAASGLNPVGHFPRVYSKKVSRTADGKIKLQIFVDEISVEVFGNDGEAAGTAAIFPKFSSQGAELYVKGGPATVNMALYPIKSIWTRNGGSANSQPTAIKLDSKEIDIEEGATATVAAKVLPIAAASDVTWTLTGDSVSIVKKSNGAVTIKGVAAGTSTLTATTVNGLSEDITVTVEAEEVGLISNLKPWKKFNGSWTMDDDGYTGDYRDGNAFTMAKGGADDFEYEADVTYHSGDAIGLMFRASGNIPNGYIVNIDKNHLGGSTRIFNYVSDKDIGATERIDFNLTPGTTYHLKLVVDKNNFKFYIDGKQYLDVTDTENSIPSGGHVGLYVFRAKATYQNVMFKGKVISGGSGGGTSHSTTEEKPVEPPVLEGWDKAIKDLEDMKTSGKVVADGASAAKIPAKVLNAIKGKNVTLQIDDKNYTWNINGENITGKLAATTNVSLKLKKMASVSTAAVKQFIVKANQVTQFQIAGTANFGFKGNLTLTVGKGYAGKTLYLSAYNEKTKRLVYKGTAKVGKDGKITYSLSGPGKYIITNQKPSTLQLAEKTAIGVGKFTYLKVRNISKNAKVTYQSNKRSVVTVSKTGKVTGVKKGTATITTKVKQGGKTYTFKTVITVK